MGLFKQFYYDSAWEYYMDTDEFRRTEYDPTGKDQHEKGAKLDAGKSKADLVVGDFARALAMVCEVGTKGAVKYTPRGWLEVPKGELRYADAQMRHYLKRKAGEERDEESGLLHLAHEAWNVLAQLELKLRKENGG
jgi:hypothetical protein